MLGELIPKGGGDPIPLLKKELLVGRRESCDIVLRFANVSAHHCEIFLREGYFFVRDLQSRNGVKVNGSRISEKRLDPGDEIAVAKHRYEISYAPYELGAVGPPPSDDIENEILGQSLLARAGLEKKKIGRDRKKERYNPADHKAGQIDLPDKPV